MAMNGKNWPIKDVDIELLRLDPKNYRLSAPENASQEYLRELLFRSYKIIELAESIVEYNGLYKSDNMIVLEDGDKYIVLEGNRRLCAIQCLIDPALIPSEYTKKFRAKTSKLTDELKSALSLVTVATSPSRDDAQWLITAKHTDYATMKWPNLRQKKRAYDAYRQLGSIERAAALLGIDDDDARESIEMYSLFQHIRNLEFWKDDELNQVIIDDLDVTKFTRNLFNEAIKLIGYSFDNQYNVISDDQARADYLLYRMMRSAFVKESLEQINTRTPDETVISYLKKFEEDYKKYKEEQKESKEEKVDSSNKSGTNSDTGKESKTGKNKEASASNKVKGKGKKPVVYFSDLKCTISNQRLTRLTNELAYINMTQFPAAATMLTRSLLESALIYQIEKKNLKNEYAEYGGRDGLKKILNFSIHIKNKLFKDPKSANGLEYLETSKYKDFMDDIVHNKWIDPTPEDIAVIAGKIRELLRAILTDSA